jgi:hypothetical protein
VAEREGGGIHVRDEEALIHWEPAEFINKFGGIGQMVRKDTQNGKHCFILSSFLIVIASGPHDLLKNVHVTGSRVSLS